MSDTRFVMILKQKNTKKEIVNSKFVGIYEDVEMLESDFDRGIVSGALCEIEREPEVEDVSSPHSPQSILSKLRVRATKAREEAFFPPLRNFRIDETGEIFGFNDIELIEVPYFPSSHYLNENRFSESDSTDQPKSLVNDDYVV